MQGDVEYVCKDICNFWTFFERTPWYLTSLFDVITSLIKYSLFSVELVFDNRIDGSSLLQVLALSLLLALPQTHCFFYKVAFVSLKEENTGE